MARKTWQIDRRTFLRGAGLSLALPWLEGMSAAAAPAELPRRACFVFFPNGVSLPPENHPAHQDWHWFPRGEGRDYTFTQSLQPLSPYRNELSILQGLSHPRGRSIVGHNTADIFLTGADISKAYANSISIDQVLARQTSVHTRFPSLVLSSDSGIGYTARTATLSFNKSGLPIPAESQPRRVFERLFGKTEGSTKAQQRTDLQNTGSMLDFLLEDSRQLSRRLGKLDQKKLDEYLASVREVEQQVDRTEAWLDVAKPHVDPTAVNLKAGTDDPAEFIRTMYDLMFLAFQTDSTRVATYQIAREDSQGVGDKFPQSINLNSHHGLSHGARKADGYADWGRYDQFLAQQLAHFLERLQGCPEGGDTLLDRTMILYGCGTSTTHQARNYPIVVAGGRQCGLKHGALHRFTEATPFANTHLTIAQAMGLGIEQFADSTAPLSQLT
ncbi:DUF1552 domain-containing protein [Lignipirellula cremea]|uniref:DUF1552 domain-containing protein n=1 Tax=Lignipirellula cremea TaxID=2528010 RepID=A0A518DL59_9BACT|nr:DUF1552 domain-containing protein [Lignipirellula cremea]QDU92572.1 hypothetical protein Pla8534_03200 [Lignipirellula cremea]